MARNSESQIVRTSAEQPSSHRPSAEAARPRPQPVPFWRHLTQLARRSNGFWILLVLIVELVTFSLILPPGTFLSTFNAQTLAADGSVLLILASGATLVVIAGGLDLSIGSIMALAAVVAELVMNDAGTDSVTAIIIGAAAGMGVAITWGFVNGFLVAIVKVPPFIVTLGSLGAALGVARLLNDGRIISGTPPSFSTNIGHAQHLGLPVPFWIGAGTMLTIGIVLHQTRFGQHTYLIGSNDEAARRGGIHVRRHLVAVYTISGALAGLAGLIDLARFDTASVSTGHVTELIAAIAAVVIGGASLYGGVGVMSGTAIGVFIPVVLANGLVIRGVERFWQDIIIGIILVAAVAFDQWRRDHELTSG
jgi:ribose transport system permease protein